MCTYTIYYIYIYVYVYMCVYIYIHTHIYTLENNEIGSDGKLTVAKYELFLRS